MSTVEPTDDAINVYANGFEVSITAADVRVALMVNGAKSAVLNLSFTSAKTLARHLNGLMDKFEGVSGHPIMVIEEVNEHLKKLGKELEKQEK